MTSDRWSPSLITDPDVWTAEQRNVFAANWIAIAPRREDRHDRS
jgi:phenylpropionate dioxygenase-like ring-hydroxylating dioxygenase large terminal subunit